MQRFVWWSSEQSYQEGRPSVLAMVEIALAIWLYWWLIPQWTGNNWHLLLSICVVPLLLFRSPQSIEQALDGFEDYVNASANLPWHSWRMFTAACFSGATTYGLLMLLPERPDATGQYVAILSAVVTFSIAAALMSFGIGVLFFVFFASLFVAGFVAIEWSLDDGVLKAAQHVSMTIAVMSLFGMYAGVSVGVSGRAMVHKFLAVMNHFPCGWQRFPGNWRCLLLAQDMCRPPEILPGDQQRERFTKFRPSTHYSVLFSVKNTSIKARAEAFFFLCIFAPASLLYRLSLKSTFWFYWPLLFAQWRVQKITVGPETMVGEHGDTAMAKLSFWGSVAVMLIAAADVLDIGSAVAKKYLYEGAVQDLATTIDSNILLFLPAAMVSFFLYLWAQHLGPRVRQDELQAQDARNLQRLISLRWVTLIGGFICAFIVFAVDNVPEYMPQPLHDFKLWIELKYFSLFSETPSQ